ncbi:hypothetical protein STEG23_010048 [Scotinomys teguina]
MKPLLDTGMSEGKASFLDMINNSERDTIRHQEELPGPEECDTMKKTVEVDCKSLEVEDHLECGVQSVEYCQHKTDTGGITAPLGGGGTCDRQDKDCWDDKERDLEKEPPCSIPLNPDTTRDPDHRAGEKMDQRTNAQFPASVSRDAQPPVVSGMDDESQTLKINDVVGGWLFRL